MMGSYTNEFPVRTNFRLVSLMIPLYSKNFIRMNRSFLSRMCYISGEHGYEDSDELRPLFIANGPLFKSNYTVTPFKNIDIYPFVMKVLHLRALPEHLKPNGTLMQIPHILRDPIKTENFNRSSSSRGKACFMLLLVCHLLIRNTESMLSVFNFVFNAKV